MASLPGEKPDRYEQLLAKYDWHSPHPPRGYQYGIGRGARPFTTTAELSIGINVGADTREESDFFNAMDRLEAKPKTRARPHGDRQDADDEDNQNGHGPSHNGADAKLSLDDLVGLESLRSTVTAPGGLVARSARTEEGELAEQYLFDDETAVVTAGDILRGKSATKEAALTSLLEMGSPDEQSTWVTRARALRELGLARKAQETLIEGCAVTGKKGTLIWEERLRYVSATENPIAYRRLLEEATAACPYAEALWLARIDALPLPQQLDCVQQAVLACPSSETLWLRVVDVAPSVADQRKLIQRAVQRSPNLPRLWARLAHLESYEAGKAIFRQVAQRHPSLELAVEAAKFVEDHISSLTSSAEEGLAPSTASRLVDEVIFARLHTAEHFNEMSRQVHVAQQHYLDVSKEWSRRNWLALAREAATGLPDGATHTGAVRCIHPWTAAFMMLYCARPNLPQPLTLTPPSSDNMALPRTWVEDILALLPGAEDDYAVLCSVSGAFLLQLLPSLTVGGSTASDAVCAADWPALRLTGGAAETRDRFKGLWRLLRRALEVVPASELSESAAGLTGVPYPGTPMQRVHDAEQLSGAATEARRPLLLSLLTALTSTLLQPLSVEHIPSFSASAEQAVVPSASARGTALAEAALLQARLALVVASGFRARGQYSAALAVLQRAESCLMAYLERARSQPTQIALPPRHETQLEDGLVHLFVACAACHERLGQPLEVAQYLSRGAMQCRNASHDIAWVGLILHQRSHAHGTSLEDTQAKLEATLRDALQAFPRSTTLWRLRLELAVEVRQRALHDTESPLTTEQRQRRQHSLTQALRQLCQQALSAPHCRFSASLWAYVAVKVEATVLNAVPTARALLAEAMTTCCPARYSATPSSSVASASDRRAHHARALLGLALAQVELRYGGGREPAHEVAADTLRRLPKTKEGAFLQPVGELLQLYIDLEVPAQKGRAAMQVMQQWKSREPLALLSVAKLYHLAKQYDRALTEAVKAVKASRVSVLANTAVLGAIDEDEAEDGDSASGSRRRGAHAGHDDNALAMMPLSLSAYYSVHSHEQSDVVYGDPLALLWKLAALPEYAKVVANRLGTYSEEELEALTSLPETVIDDWVRSTVSEALHGGARAPAEGTHSTPISDADTQRVQQVSVTPLVPNAGPVWLAVTEGGEAAARVVTMTGYSTSTETLLREAVEQLVLS